MIRKVLVLLLGIAVIYVLVAAVVFASQRHLLYHPEMARADPVRAGAQGAELVEIATPDGERLVAWYAPPSTPLQPTVLFFHGNAGSIADRSDRFNAYRRAGFGVLFPSWRGYGGSTGKPTEQGLKIDAVAAYDWLIAKGVAPERLVVVGESLGTGLAVSVAAAHPIAALALEAPYSSMVEVAAHHYPWLPVRLLLLDRFDSLQLIGKIKVPVIMFHGDADTVVPFMLGRKLFDAAPEPKQFVVIPGGGHGAIFDEPVWSQEIAFFRRIIGESQE